MPRGLEHADLLVEESGGIEQAVKERASQSLQGHTKGEIFRQHDQQNIPLLPSSKCPFSSAAGQRTTGGSCCWSPTITSCACAFLEIEDPGSRLLSGGFLPAFSRTRPCSQQRFNIGLQLFLHFYRKIHPHLPPQTNISNRLSCCKAMRQRGSVAWEASSITTFAA